MLMYPLDPLVKRLVLEFLFLLFQFFYHQFGASHAFNAKKSTSNSSAQAGIVAGEVEHDFVGGKEKVQ